MKYSISFTLNGKPVTVEAPATVNLLRLLREYLGMTGTKFGCEEGDCGTCTVEIDGWPVNSCMVLAMTVDGREVTTIEGIGTIENPHPIQRAFYEYYGAQCGFCTPGMIMSTKSLLERSPTPTREEINEAISGNLCRCTGYHKIVEAVEAAAGMMKEGK